MTTAALVGLTAPHSKGWLETLRITPEIERLLVCDLEGAVPESDDGIDGVYSGLDAMFDSVRPDFALVSVRNDQAADAGSRFLSEEIPLIIEKPAGRTAAEIAELNVLSRLHSTPWATGFTNRLAPAVCEMRRLVAAGALGRVVSIEGRMVTSSVDQRNKDHWLFSKEVAGGGILHWLAIHTIDLIRFITGLEYDSVSAHVATLSETGVDVEDTASVSFSMSNGAVGSLHAGYMLRKRYGDISLAVRGTLGDVAWSSYGFDGAGNTVHLQSEAPGWETIARQKVDLEPQGGPGYGGRVGTEFVARFLRCSQAREEFVTDGEDALGAMRFVEAAYASSASGESIKL